jgi:hypothetical protein
VHYTDLWIPEENVTIPPGETLPKGGIKSGEHYFRIWLSEMFLKNDRDWGASWYPAVLASVELKFGNNTTELTHVAGETTLKNFDMKALNKGVSVNHEITTLIPFNGGTVRLEAALLAMQGKSDPKSLVKILGDFSKLLVVPQLSSALVVAEPLVNGITELIGATNAHPELRIQNTWTGSGVGGANVLRPGYFAVISAKSGEIAPASLFVRNNQLYFGENQLTGYHYMLFRVDVTETRDDYDSLTSIAEPYNEALGMLSNALTQDDPAMKDKMMKDAENRYAATRLAAFRAPELTTTVGRNQVLEALKRRWDEAKSQLGAGGFADSFPRTLKAAMRNPIPAEAAIEIGERRDESELWQ